MTTATDDAGGDRTGDGGLFAPIVTPDDLLAATGPRAWLRAMLDAESGLAEAEAAAGVIPASAAEAIARRCVEARFDPDELGRAARGGGNPVIPLVSALTTAVGEPEGRWVHWGATSQDILDTAAALVAQRAGALIDGHLAALCDACAGLAERHRSTVMVARTLLQQAVPTTFGLKAAGWLSAGGSARHRLATALAGLTVQLGGAGGTLASLGDAGPTVLAGFAVRLGLAEPDLPWHSDRTRVADLGTALGMVAGVAAKVALDVGLLMQTEVAEAAEPAAPGRGGSSSMPHKRNPVGAAAVGAAARRAHALVPVLLGSLAAEHERAVGGWQAEWDTLADLLRLAGGAAARAADTVAGLEVDPARMRANAGLTGGLIMAERVAVALAPALGRPAAKAAVERAAGRVAEGTRFADALRSDPEIAKVVTAEEVDGLLDPPGYLGATDAFIDRALAAHRRGGAARSLTPPEETP